jgi:hypothetical protein
MTKKKSTIKEQTFTPAEQRAARSERVVVEEAEPYGWMARSDSGDAQQEYHLFCDPETRHLACTCGDFIFRGNADFGYECKHVVATLKFIARQYLSNQYDPQRQRARASAPAVTQHRSVRPAPRNVSRAEA